MRFDFGESYLINAAMKAASVASNYLYDFGIQLMKIAINSIGMIETVSRHIHKGARYAIVS